MCPHYVQIPILQIRPGLLLTYDILDPRPYREEHSQSLNLNPIEKEKTYTGLITKGSAKRLRKCINILISLSEWKEALNFKTGEIFKFKINFITLTLPCPQYNVSDADLKNHCLKPLLRKWRKRFPGISYVWRAERQKNGNLHFHICSDRYIYYIDIRDSWNQLLNKFHFLAYYKLKHNQLSVDEYLALYPPNTKYPQDRRIASFHRGCDSHWSTPNSTDVHSVNKIDDLAGYLVKYMAKLDPLEQKIEGRVWDASTNLKKADYCDTVIDTAISQELRDLSSNPDNRQFLADRCTGLFLNPSNFEKSLPPAISNTYQGYLQELRNQTLSPA